MTGDKGVVSKVIQFFTWSSFSHVELMLPGWLAHSALPSGGVAIRTPTESTEEVLLAFDVADLAAALREAESMLGTSYDVGALLSFFYRKNGGWQDPRKWFCSEAIAKILHAGKRFIVREDAVSRIPPEAIYAYAGGRIVTREEAEAILTQYGDKVPESLRSLTPKAKNRIDALSALSVIMALGAVVLSVLNIFKGK